MRRAMPGARSTRTLEDDHLYRRPTAVRHGKTDAARWASRPSSPMPSRFSHPSLAPATFWSWTICPPTRSAACARTKGWSAVPVLPANLAALQPHRVGFLDAKALLRKAAARTVDGLWSAIAECLPALIPRMLALFSAGCDRDSIDPDPQRLVSAAHLGWLRLQTEISQVCYAPCLRRRAVE